MKRSFKRPQPWLKEFEPNKYLDRKIKGIWGRFGDWWSNLWGGLTKLGHLGTKAMASNLTNGLKHDNSLLTQMKNGKKHPSKSKITASKDANKLPGNVFASHALGTSGAEMHSHAALVGEGGTELAYTVNGRRARLLGANGPEITHVKHGERILNHRDTKKGTQWFIRPCITWICCWEYEAWFK